MKKYQLPKFLSNIIEQKVYERWLHRKAIAHVRRDRKRGNKTAFIESWKLLHINNYYDKSFAQFVEKLQSD